MAKTTIHVSATEIPAFRRLVAFVEEVQQHADQHSDDGLDEVVRQLRIDLLALIAERMPSDDVDRDTA